MKSVNIKQTLLTIAQYLRCSNDLIFKVYAALGEIKKSKVNEEAQEKKT